MSNRIRGLQYDDEIDFGINIVKIKTPTRQLGLYSPRQAGKKKSWFQNHCYKLIETGEGLPR